MTKGANNHPSKRESTALIKREVAVAAKRHAARANDLLDLIERRLARIKDDFYDIGLALKELRDDKLHAALGFRTFDELLAKRKIVGRSQAYKLIAVVEHVSRRDAVSLGEEKAYALARLVDATPAGESVDGAISHGVVVGKKRRDVHSMSRREIDAARRAIAPRKAPGEQDAHHAAAHAQATLRSKIPHVSIEVVRHGHEWWAVVRLPIDDLPTLTRERSGAR